MFWPPIFFNLFFDEIIWWMIHLHDFEHQVINYNPFLPVFWGFDLDFRGFLEPKGFLSIFNETRYNLVTTAADLQDPLPEELAKKYQDAKFITVGPLLPVALVTQTLRFFLMFCLLVWCFFFPVRTVTFLFFSSYLDDRANFVLQDEPSDETYINILLIGWSCDGWSSRGLTSPCPNQGMRK